MRWMAGAAALFLAAAAHAERLVFIPVGKKVPFREARLETLAGPANGTPWSASLDVGIGKSFDASVRWSRFPGDTDRPSFDLAYNYLSPVVGFAPGVSLGFLDLADATAERRRFFFAVTWAQGLAGDFTGRSALEFTLGTMTGARGNVFVGVHVPFTDRIGLLAEHDGLRLTGGLEVQPTRWATARFLVRDHRPLVSLTLARRF